MFVGEADGRAVRPWTARNSAIADNILPPLCKGRDAAVRSTVKTVHRRLFLAKAAKQLCYEPGVVSSSSVSETKNGRIVIMRL